MTRRSRVDPPTWPHRRRLLGTLLALSLAVVHLGHEPAGAQSPASVATAGAVLPAVAADGLGVPGSLSVALVEAATGQVLVAQDATTRRPVASVIKLLTALVVVDAIPPRSSVTIGDEVRDIEGASYGLRPGEVRSVEDLLAGLLLRSGNDVAVALAVAVAGSEAAFVDRMEDRLAALGIPARPASASGLATGDALSALEVAVVARAALAEPRISDIVARADLVLPTGARLTNRNTFLLDDATATGLKTGFTNAAGFTLAASAERGGRPLIAVVLGARDDTERRDVARRLIEHGFSATRLTQVTSTLSIRSASGPFALRVDLGTVTLGSGSDLLLAWPITLRPDDGPTRIPVLVGGVAVGDVTAEPLDGRVEVGRVNLGRALADGVYAALRPTAIALTGGPARSGGGALR